MLNSLHQLINFFYLVFSNQQQHHLCTFLSSINYIPLVREPYKCINCVRMAKNFLMVFEDRSDGGLAKEDLVVSLTCDPFDSSTKSDGAQHNSLAHSSLEGLVDPFSAMRVAGDPHFNPLKLLSLILFLIIFCSDT